MGFLDMTMESKVGEFNTAAGKEQWDHDSPVDMSVLTCIKEECFEFLDAVHEYEEALNDEEADADEFRKNLVKEWADLQYVVSQAAWYFDIPAEPAFNRVHANNMTKVVDGRVRFREDGKILKPKGYVKADMSGL